MRTKAVKDFIIKNERLFWYSPQPKDESVSDELLVESVLNYGNIDTVKQLFSIMGIKNVANIFFQSITKSERSRHNYHELTRNFFTLLFNRYAY